MEKKRLRKVRKGDPILAEDWNALVDMVIRNDIRTGGGLDIQKTSNGTVLSAPRRADRYVAKATSDFPIRSGTTVSSGSVDIYRITAVSGSTATIGAVFEIEEAWCISSTETSASSGKTVLSGQYGYAFQDPFGDWWFTPDECPA